MLAAQEGAEKELISVVFLILVYSISMRIIPDMITCHLVRLFKNEDSKTIYEKTGTQSHWHSLDHFQNMDICPLVIHHTARQVVWDNVQDQINQ